MADRDLSAAVGRLLLDDNEPAMMSGPIANPIDRFIHLPEPTRRWFESLREEDIAKLKKLGRLSEEDLDDLVEAIRFQRSARTIGRFGKWVIITVVSTFIGAVALGEKIGVAWKWVIGGPR